MSASHIRAHDNDTESYIYLTKYHVSSKLYYIEIKNIVYQYSITNKKLLYICRFLCYEIESYLSFMYFKRSLTFIKKKKVYRMSQKY